jgi:hypothetical protein
MYRPLVPLIDHGLNLIDLFVQHELGRAFVGFKGRIGVYVDGKGYDAICRW